MTVRAGRGLTNYITGQWHNIVHSRFVTSLLRLAPTMLYISWYDKKLETVNNAIG